MQDSPGDQRSAREWRVDLGEFRRRTCFLGSILVLFACRSSMAQESSPPEETLTPPRDLARDLLDDLPSAQQTRGNPLRDRTSELLRPASLAAIGHRMQTAGKRIRGGRISRATQELQSEIVAELDALIRRRSQQGNSQSQGATSAGKPAPQSGDPTGKSPGTAPDGVSPPAPSAAQDAQSLQPDQALRRVWGHLPEMFQRDIQTPLHEDFLPHYRRVIEDYYKRLSEMRPD